MTRRQALLAMQLAPFGSAVWSTDNVARTPDWPKPFIRVVLGGKDGISRLEVQGPNGEIKTFTPEEIWEALSQEVSEEVPCQ